MTWEAVHAVHVVLYAFLPPPSQKAVTSQTLSLQS